MPTNRFGDHSSSGHLSRILDDKTPQLGGMLDGNGFTFNGAVAFEANAGEALSKGNAVYVSGISGNKPVVMKADADDAAKMPAFGIAETDASLNANVNVVTFGTVYEIDTSAYAAGDELYVSTTAGELTATKPTGATAKLQNIGKVIRSHASAGSIKVGGAGRTNAVPNLDDGTVFIGDSNNQAEQRALVLADISDYTAPTETDTLDSVTGRGNTTANDITVGNLTSTGIDDNATLTRLTISNSGVDIDGLVTGGAFIVDGTPYGLGAGGQLTSTGIDDNATSTAITIDSSQNVGIGVTSPSATLDVAGSIENNNYYLQKNTSDSSGTSADIILSTNSTDRRFTISKGNQNTLSAPDAFQITDNINNHIFLDYTPSSTAGTLDLHADGTGGEVRLRGAGAEISLYGSEILLNNTTIVSANAEITGSLEVDVNLQVDGQLDVAGATNLDSKLTITNANYDNHIELNRSSEQWRFSPSTDGSLDIRRVSGTGDAIVDLPKTIVTDSLGATTISGAGVNINRSTGYVSTASAGQQLRFQSDVVTVYDQNNTTNRFQVSSSGISTPGTVTASGGNSTNWNTAYSDTSAASVSNVANTLVRRSADGDSYHRYLYTSYVNMSHGTGTRSSDTIFYSSTDNFLRKTDATGMRASLSVPTRTGGDASGTWGISITGNAGTASNSSDSDMQTMHDTRAALLAPNSYPDKSIYGEFTNQINGSWWSAITAKGWSDGYAAWQLIGYSSTGTDNRLYFKNSHGSNNTWSGLQQVWHAGSDGSGSGLDADTVDGVDSSRIIFGADATGTTSTSPTATLKSGFYNSYITGVPTSTWYNVIHCRHSNTGNNYGHQFAGSFYSTGDIYNRNINNNTFGAWTKIWNASNDGSGSGLDADLLDGVNSSSFLRSDTTDYLNGILYVRADIRNETAYRDHGVYGHYDSYKINHIWSMGSAYRVPADGSSFGNLYGAAYTYHNRVYTSNTMGGYHQMVWCQNGTPNCALGSNIWTSGNVTAYSDIRVKTNIKVIPDALEKVKKLNGYTFDRTDIKDEETGEAIRQTGVVAQEVLKVLPEAVTGNEDSHYNVAYGNMVGLLIEAIKEQQTQIEELKEKLEWTLQKHSLTQ